MAKRGNPPKKTGGRSFPSYNDPKGQVENVPTPAAPPLPKQRQRGKKPTTFASCSPLSVSFRHIRGSAGHSGWRGFIQFVEYAARTGDEDMARLHACYLALTPRDKKNVWPEQLCQLAGVNPGDLVGAVCKAIWESKAAESSMISAIAHPEVLLELVKLAKDPKHYQDREMFFRMTGSLPDKKGSSINIINNPTAQMGAVKLDGRPGSRLPSMDEDVIEMSRQLDAPAPFLVNDDVPPQDH